MALDYDHLFTILPCSSSSGIGKTALLDQYCCGEFSERTPFTIGMEFYTRTININNQRIKLKMWDTNGSMSFRSIIMHYMRDNGLIIFCISLVNEIDVQREINFINELRLAAPVPVPIIVVGTKLDLVKEDDNRRRFSQEEAQQFAKTIGAIGYFECSAKTGENVEAIFNFIAGTLTAGLGLGPLLLRAISKEDCTTLMSLMKQASKEQIQRLLSKNSSELFALIKKNHQVELLEMLTSYYCNSGRVDTRLFSSERETLIRNNAELDNKKYLGFKQFIDTCDEFHQLELLNRVISQHGYLSNIELSDKQLKTVCQALTTETCYTALDLSKNNFTDAGISSLQHVLAHPKKIQRLYLNDNKISNKSARWLLTGLEQNTTLQILDLTGNPIGNEILAAISARLLQNSQLEQMLSSKTLQLDMSIISSLTDRFFAVIAPQLQGLTSICITPDFPTKRLVAGLASVTQNITSLQTLVIEGQDFSVPNVANTFVQTLSQSNLLRQLTLSHCNLDDKFIKDNLEPLLRTSLATLQELKLSQNNISYTGIRRLAAIRHDHLAVLDLSANRIAGGKSLFEKLAKDFAKYPALKTLRLDQNFIDKKCKSHFQKQVLTSNQALYCYGIYQTQAKPVTSLLAKQYNISRDQWIVSLVCKKGTEHAMLYMEGMSNWGQRFLVRYHITAEGLIGFANVSIEEPNIKVFDPTDYHSVPKVIDKIAGRTLQDLIEDDKKKQIEFSKFSPNSSRGKVNCLKWCIQKLDEIDVPIEGSLLGLPSNTAKGSTCVIQ